MIAPVVVAVCPGVANAYRTASELPLFEGSEPVRWRQSNVLFDSGEGDAPEAVAFGAELEALRTAAELWGSLDCQGPTLSNSGTRGVPIAPGDGVNAIAWVAAEDMPGGVPDDAPAIADVQYESDGDETWHIAEADLYLNRDIEWGGAQGADLATVLAHELGHVLGLLHPCEPGGDADGAPDCSRGDFEDSIMFPLYDASGAMLAQDDRDGYCSLYGSIEWESECGVLECVTPGADVEADAGAIGDAGKRGGPREPVPFGGACETASDCSDGLCVEDGDRGAVCTRACGADAGVCPDDWSCAEVDDARVCVNPRSDSCQVQSPGMTSRAASARWFGLLSLLAAARFSRRRTRFRMRVNCEV